jgi:hypothetical protein
MEIGHMFGRTVGVVLAVVVGASLADAEETRGLGAHEHGHSTLNIAIEGERVMMELDAPGMDIVGFEHAATSDNDKAAVARAEATLADPLKLFVLPSGARCTVETADVALAGEAHEEHTEEEHAEDGAGEEDPAHADEDRAGHTEFHATYTLGCDNPDELRTIRFAFFERFQGAEEVEVNVVTEQGQTSYEVERNEPVIDIGGMM